MYYSAGAIETFESNALAVDPNTGNILLGGASLSLTTLDYVQVNRNAYLMFLNNLGDIIWGYTFGMV
jgi:hypothetical protein